LPDLVDQIIKGNDFESLDPNDSDPMDEGVPGSGYGEGHGTAVASVIALLN